MRSSSLNKSAARYRKLEANQNRVGTLNWGDNFGLIVVDWQADDPLVRLQIRDVAGDIMIQRKVPLGTITRKGE